MEEYMAEQKGHSEEGLAGNIIHYDEHGNKIGESWPSLSGGYDTYDAKGNKTGTTYEGLFGGYVSYDEHGRKTGTTYRGIVSNHHYDEHGRKTGTSTPHIVSTSSSFAEDTDITTRLNSMAADGAIHYREKEEAQRLLKETGHTPVKPKQKEKMPDTSLDPSSLQMVAMIAEGLLLLLIFSAFLQSLF